MEGTTRTVQFLFPIGSLVFLRQQAEGPEKTLCWAVESHEAIWCDTGVVKGYRLCVTTDQYGKKDCSRISVPECQMRPWPPEEKTIAPLADGSNPHAAESSRNF